MKVFRKKRSMGVYGTSGMVLGVQCVCSTGCKKPKADEAGEIGGR